MVSGPRANPCGLPFAALHYDLARDADLLTMHSEQQRLVLCSGHDADQW